MLKNLKKWLAIRIGIITALSVTSYFMVDQNILFVLPRDLIPATAWLVVSCVIASGFTISYFQLGDKKSVNIKKPFNMQKLKRNHEKPELSLEEALKLDSLGENPNPKNFAKILENSTLQTLTNSDITVELEIPQGTDLTILGQKCTVNKGKIKITSQKAPKQSIEELFPGRKKRRPK